MILTGESKPYGTILAKNLILGNCERKLYVTTNLRNSEDFLNFLPLINPRAGLGRNIRNNFHLLYMARAKMHTIMSAILHKTQLPETVQKPSK
jgi:hypothetical protein